MTMKLTDTQTLILNTAIQASNGQLSWFPDNLKGGARDKVLWAACCGRA
jgi:hypothetical protein